MNNISGPSARDRTYIAINNDKADEKTISSDDDWFTFIQELNGHQTAVKGKVQKREIKNSKYVISKKKPCEEMLTDPGDMFMPDQVIGCIENADKTSRGEYMNGILALETR